MVAAAGLGHAVESWRMRGQLVSAIVVLCSAAAVLLAPAPARADQFALVVSGASGGPQYAETYASWRQDLVEALRDQPGFRDDHLLVLGEIPGPGVGRASRGGIEAAVDALRQRMADDALLLVVLIGHGTDDGVDARFNLVGPDMSAAEWRRLLDSLPGRAVFVNTTASSLPFVRRLAREGRVVIAATASPAQRYDTVFPRFFVAAVADPASDADKDGRVSVWEAFVSASARVRRWYQQEGRLATERAVLDDSGDGIGVDADRPGTDGRLAAGLYFGAGVAPPAAAGDPALAPLVERREALAAEVAALRVRKAALPEPEYARELERLLLELARVSRELRQRAGSD